MLPLYFRCIFLFVKISPEMVETIYRYQSGIALHGLAFRMDTLGWAAFVYFYLKALYIQLVTAVLERVYHSIA